MTENKRLKVIIFILSLIATITIVMLLNNKSNAQRREMYNGNCYNSYLCDGNRDNCENWDNSYLCNGNRNNCENWDNSYFCNGNRNNCENWNASYSHHGNRDSSHLHNRKCN